MLARGHQNLIWARTRHTNGLRSRCASTTRPPWRRSRTWPTATPSPCWAGPRPQRGCPAEPAGDRVGAQTRWPPTQHRRPAREIQAALRTEQLAAPAAVVAAFAATTSAAVGIIAELNRQIGELETSLAARFETAPGRRHLPLPARTWCHPRRPGARRVRGRPEPLHQRQVSQELRRHVTPHRRVRQETRRAGPPRPQPPPLRRHRPMGLLRPDHQPGRPAFYDQRRAAGDLHHQALAPSATASSASSTAASATTPPTTNTRLGPPQPRPPLDDLRAWDV